MDFTLLKTDHVWGKDALNVIKMRGKNFAPTDLAVLLGAEMTRTNARTDEGELGCFTWLATVDISGGEPRAISPNGAVSWSTPTRRGVAVLPVMTPESSRFVDLRLVEIRNPVLKMPIYTYGEYPQTVADEKTDDQLHQLFLLGSLPQTGKSYTFDEMPLDSHKEFKPEKHLEYEYKGKRYVRVRCRCSDGTLSNGKPTEKHRYYWVQVEPIEWFKDKSGYLIPRKCLFSGIQYDTKSDLGFFPHGDFDFSKTFLSHYLDTYFANEMCNPMDRVALKEKKMAAEDRRKARQKRYGITISDKPMSVNDQIRFHIQNRMSLMLHGPSGVGKTRRVQAIDPELTSITLCNGILPEEVIGKTRYPDGKAGNKAEGGVWAPPRWYTDLCEKCDKEPDKPHVLFIDEVTNARETTQSLIYHIVLERSIAQGVGKLPENAVVILAGNSKEESGAAYNMPAPLFRRLSHMHLDLNIPEWLEWGSERNSKYPNDPNRLNIHPLVSSFVATYGRQVFYSEYNEEEPVQFALDPRKWERVSDKIYANGGGITKELLRADIGPELTETFAAYANNPPLSLEEVMKGEYGNSDIPNTQDARLALALNLRHASEKEVGTVREFIKGKLGAEMLSVFDSVWVGKDDARAVQIANLHMQQGGR